MKYVSKCPICQLNSLSTKKKYSKVLQAGGIRRYMPFFIELAKDRKFDFYISLCEKCGFLFINPRYDDEDFKINNPEVAKEFYQEKIYPKEKCHKRLHRALRTYKIVEKFYESKLNDKPDLLDYGGYAGYILPPFLNNFNCFLIDKFKWKLPEGVKFLGRDCSEIEKNKKFDVILCLRVLEHVNDPRRLIEDFKNYLSKDGIIYVQVPLGCLNEWKSLIKPFGHVNFFSSESLYKCFKLSGLNVIHLKTILPKTVGDKGWKIDIIATKDNRSEIKPSKILSTKQQMMRFFYLFLLLFKKYNYKITIIKKKFKKMIKHLT